jgi:hypothetical protein
LDKKENRTELLFIFTVVLNIILNILGFEFNIVKIFFVLILISIFLYFASKDNKFKEKRYYIYLFVMVLIFAENIYTLYKM